VHETIAARGLQRFLDGMEPICSSIKDTLLASPDFGPKIMLTLDNHLQNFDKTVATTSPGCHLPTGINALLMAQSAFSGI
jgi:hypothetical protein